jgi:hypothetical protein
MGSKATRPKSACSPEFLPRMPTRSQFGALKTGRGKHRKYAPYVFTEQGVATGLALGIIAVESSLPAAFLYQRKHRVDRWRSDLDEAAHFLDGGDECIDL